MKNFHLRHNETGTTLPLFIGMIVLVFILLMTTLATTEMAIERTRQQSSADLAALAGANALCKATDTKRVIDFSIWARNATLDALYLAAAIASISSAGAGSASFKVPLDFQKATIKPVEALERTKAAVVKSAMVYSAANGMSVVKANDKKNSGLVVPVPLFTEKSGPSQRQKDLTKMIATYEGRIDQSKGEMNEAILEYEEKKTQLLQDGLKKPAMKKDRDVRRLRSKVHETSGRVGGLMSQRNRRRRELDRLKNKDSGSGSLQDKVVAVVYHPSTLIPFTSMLGGIETGDNIAIAAAVVADTPDDMIIGEDAIKNLFSKNKALKVMSGGMGRILDSINLVGHKARRLESDYGVMGGYVGQALDKIGIMPPSITQTRPALISVEKAVADKNGIYKLIRAIESN